MVAIFGDYSMGYFAASMVLYVILIICSYRQYFKKEKVKFGWRGYKMAAGENRA